MSSDGPASHGMCHEDLRKVFSWGLRNAALPRYIYLKDTSFSGLSPSRASILATMKLRNFLVCSLCLLSGQIVGAQLGLSHGFLNLTSPSFSIQLVKDSQTLYSLRPIGSSFDFIPGDMMEKRQSNGQYHLGDLTFRVRKVGSTAWVSGDTSTARRPVTAISTSGTTLAAANLAPTLPSSSLLNIIRRWVVQDDVLELLFDVTNSQNTAVEIGALGIPLEFNNVRSR